MRVRIRHLGVRRPMLSIWNIWMLWKELLWVLLLVSRRRLMLMKWLPWIRLSEIRIHSAIRRWRRWSSASKVPPIPIPHSAIRRSRWSRYPLTMRPMWSRTSIASIVGVHSISTMPGRRSRWRASSSPSWSHLIHWSLVVSRTSWTTARTSHASPSSKVSPPMRSPSIMSHISTSSSMLKISLRR